MSSLSISSCSDPELYQMFISMQTDSDCFDPVQHVVPGDSQSMSVSDGSSEVYLVAPDVPSKTGRKCSKSSMSCTKRQQRRKSKHTGVHSKLTKAAQKPLDPSNVDKVQKLPGRCTRPTQPRSSGEDPQFQPARLRRVAAAGQRELLPESQPYLQEIIGAHPSAKNGLNKACFDMYMKKMLGEGSMSPEELEKLGRPVEGAAVYWPNKEEYSLKQNGVLPYLARFMSHATGVIITPDELETCFISNTTNQYQVDYDKLKQYGIDAKSLKVPLKMHTLVHGRSR